MVCLGTSGVIYRIQKHALQLLAGLPTVIKQSGLNRPETWTATKQRRFRTLES